MVQVRQKLNKEIQEGRMAGPFEDVPFENFQVSPLALRPKKTPGEFRLLHNLSYPYNETSINAQISAEDKHVKYASINDAIKKILSLPRGSYAAKTDVAHAFKLIPVKPEQYHKLGIHFDGKYYYDKTLPQGCASSCRIFETFSSAIQWILEQRVPGILCVHYLDDFLIIANNRGKCQQHLQVLLDLCDEIGVPTAPDKTTLPATNIIFLGIELDTSLSVARLPTVKLFEYSQLLAEVSQQRKIRKSELDSLVGKLNFASSVIPAKPYLRRLINLGIGVKKPYYFVRLTKHTKADMAIWLQFLEQYNGITFFRQIGFTASNEINMCSDASKIGFGATYGSKWIQARWPEAWTKLHIAILELYPIYVIVAMFSHLIRNSNILFYCDNSAVVSIINKQSSTDNTIMSIMRPLVLILMKDNIYLRAKHLPGIDNILADKISRFQVDAQLLQQYGMQPEPLTIPDCLLPDRFRLR